MKQAQPCETDIAHEQPAPGGPQFPMAHGSVMQSQVPGEAAKAGVSMLVMTGTVHATATPVPIRFSILRREMPVGVAPLMGSSDNEFTSSRPWSSWPKRLPGRFETAS